MINSEKEWDFMDAINNYLEEDIIQIEEILTEANAYNLRNEVMITAQSFIKDDPDLDKVAAFQMAYIEWIKN